MSAAARRVRGAIWAAGLLAVALLSTGCATAPAAAGPGTAAGAAPAAAKVPGDPWEGFNRKIFAFNDTVDTYALKPIAQGYKKVVPEMVRTGVENVFGNVADVWSIVNNVLQGKIGSGLRMTMRVATNTTIGLGGLLDPASEMGLERESEDLGQTLGRWGMPPGPYLVLPLFGPSDLRDTTTFPLDHYASPALFAPTTAGQVGITTLGVVSTRAGLLDASKMLDDIALDRYSFLRDAYLARRRNLVYDGNPPEPPESDDGAPAAAPAAPASAPAPAAPASAPAAAASAPG